MSDAIRCSNIIKQVNDHANRGGLLTSDIGLKNGTTTRSCWFCLDRLWALIKGVSYNKNEVAKSINTAFQGVNLSYLKVSKAELETFCRNVNQLNLTFGKGNKFDQSLLGVITTTSTHVLQKKPTGQALPVPKVASQRATVKTGHMGRATAARPELGRSNRHSASSSARTPFQSRRVKSYGTAASLHRTSRRVGVSAKAQSFLAFYHNGQKGRNGFTIDEILNFKEAELEKHHDFIQFLFPTYQSSRYCSYAPTLNPEIVQAFQKDSSLRSKQKQALTLMLGHYGLRLDPHTDKISIDPIKFKTKKKNFFVNGSHNLLRITRILSSLKSLGQPELAKEFYNCLEGLSKGSLPQLKSALKNYWQPVVMRGATSRASFASKVAPQKTAATTRNRASFRDRSRMQSTRGRFKAHLPEGVKIGKTSVQPVIGDIRDLRVEAIVNAANERLLGGSGIDGVIHSAAGPDLRKECAKLPLLKGSKSDRIKMGDAVVTSSFKLKGRGNATKAIVHTVGPRGSTVGRKGLLANTYKNSLIAAHQKGIRSIAFPAISVGIFSYPFKEAQEIAFKTVKAYVEANPNAFDTVIFVYHNKDIGKKQEASIQNAWKEKVTS